MEFTPLKFQGTLAAGGVALMPYIFLKNNILKIEEDIALSHLTLLSSGSLEHITALFLTTVMGLFIVSHIVFTVFFTKQLIVWLFKTNEIKKLINNPLTSSSVFSPLISLPMSLIVFFGPVSFFFPVISLHKQLLTQPAFAIFSFLWGALIILKIMDTKTIFTQTVEYEKLSFGWLLDVLAFGAVSLLGANIAITTNSNLISSTTAFMTMASLVIGIIIFIIKTMILLSQQSKSKTLPNTNILPAFFLVIPPMCLLGFGLFKLLGYTSEVFLFDIRAISFLVIVSSYLMAMSWFIFVIFLLKDTSVRL